MPTITFAWPFMALLFVLLPFLGWFIHRNNVPSPLFHPLAPALKTNLGTRSLTKNPLRLPFWPTLIGALLILSLMRPQIIGESISLPQEARSIMLVVDISESMSIEDMVIDNQQTDRLSALKHLLGEFIKGRQGDRLGLILFGSETFLHAPLTFDLVTVDKFLHEAEIGFLGPRTAIGDGLGLGIKKLLNEPFGDKVILLITDGQNNTGAMEPLEAASIAKSHGIKMYIVGMGSSRMVTDGFFGKTVVNPSADLDHYEPALKHMALSTGGNYFRGKDTASLQEIYGEIDRLEPVKGLMHNVVPKKELFYWILMIIPLLLMLRFLGRFRFSYGV